MKVPDRQRVLIVDDSDMNRKLARDVLQAAGLRTLEARSCAEAVARAAEHVPDLILMDLQLPDGDGTDAMRRIRAAAPTSSIPVVAVTALRLDAGDDWLLAAGFAGYISKPIDTDALPDLVRSYLPTTPRDE